jgi:hypothetical protein
MFHETDFMELVSSMTRLKSVSEVPRVASQLLNAAPVLMQDAVKLKRKMEVNTVQRILELGGGFWSYPGSDRFTPGSVSPTFSPHNHS